MSGPAALVVPLLGQEPAWLDQCLRSALRQTVECEIVVVTAPTTPEVNLAQLRELARQHPRLRSLQQPAGGGFPAAVNVGWRAARASRIGLLLSDDWLEPTAVEESLGLEADIVSAGIRHYEADGVTALGGLRDDVVTLAAFRQRSTLEQRAAYLQHFLLFSRASLERVGGLDETLGDAPGIDDYDLVWTLLERGATVAVVGRSLYNYRDHSGARLTLRPREQACRALERILAKHGVTGEEARSLVEAKSRWLGRRIGEVLAQRDPERAR